MKFSLSDISSPKKSLYPEQDMSKSDIGAYYASVSALILPHLKDRPIMMQRFPDGINEDGFYQKEAGNYFPDWIETRKIQKKEGGSTDYVICQNESTLLYLVNQGCLTFHGWLSQVSDLNCPDRLVIDLDPPADNLDPVIEGARQLKKAFQKVNVTSFLMTTGSKGFHVIIFLDRKSKFDQVRETGRLLGEKLIEGESSNFTLEQRLSKRDGKVYFDIQRNAFAQTSVIPYSLRPYPHAPIATPLDWDELSKNMHSKKYQFDNILRRLSQKADPWQNHGRHRYSITSLKDKFQKL